MPPKADRVFGCPECSFRVSGNEKACPRCGKAFERGTKFECPFCGARIPKKSKRCSSCQMDLSSLAERQAPIDAEVGELECEEDLKLTCPECGQPLTGTETECPKCWRALTGRLALNCPLCGTPIDRCLTACPICGTSIERMIQNADHTGLVAATHPCPICESIIPDGLKRCPVCKNDLEEARRSKEPQPEAVPPEQAPEPTEVKAEGQATPSPRPARQRKLKAKVTTVPVTSQTGIRGLTNGVGQINGLGKVNGTGKINGTGAVNGRAFVNGTGTPTAPAQRPTKGIGKRSVLRWQLLVIVVAILIVVPTATFFLYSNKGGKYSIDGSFDEWAGATTYGSRIPSVATSDNVTAWAVAAESPFLYFFMQTETTMMGSSNPENFYLFVDSDGTNSTGYLTQTLGADYLLQLSGWDSKVQSAQIFGHESADHRDWNAWSPTDVAACYLDNTRLEAKAYLGEGIKDSAKFLLVSKDASDRGSVSCIAPLSGGVLVIEQSLSLAVPTDGVLQKANSVPFLALKFTCYGEGGLVTKVDPKCFGAQPAAEIQQFSLQEGEEKIVTLALDTSLSSDGQIVSADLTATGISSTFALVDIVGEGAKARVGAQSAGIQIDGLFADWSGKLSVDSDLATIANPCVDIDEVGNASDLLNSYFYVSVEGELCRGTYVPAVVAKPSGTGGTIVVPTRRTAEDILNIYIDSDGSESTGETVILESKRIGADQKIEIKGLFGHITSRSIFDFSETSAAWVKSQDVIDAEKDERRIEIGASASSLGGSSDFDFIVETTSWRGMGDRATFDPNSLSPTTRTWVVAPALDSPYATSMSYQRKVFFDGVNYWSFYFDGADTVYRYSIDAQTWNYCGPVFSSAGVNETSIWYDEPTSTVYAVGDTATATQNLTVQAGVVNPSAHTISWMVTDSLANVSRLPLGGKNAYISKDVNGFLWILSSGLVQAAPAAYQLIAVKSAEANNTSSWLFSGTMGTANFATDNIKGSIVPAGKGSDVWAVYGYAGNVASRKCNGTWLAQVMIYTQAGSKASTDNSPPSALVDGKGVVHVVYGTGRRAGQISIPAIEYSHNVSGGTTFSLGVALDPLLPAGVGDYYPTITLESSSGDLYALWLRGDNFFVPRTVMGSTCVAGTWSYLVLPPQTNFPKTFLTSAYSAEGPYTVCWQWTENVTAPINVVFDGTIIPEFEDFFLPAVGFVFIFAATTRGVKSRRLQQYNETGSGT